jgi:hypothetical protein
MGQAGDRTDREIGDFLRAACDLEPDQLLVCDLPGYERGRETGVVSDMLRDFALAEGVPADAITVFKCPVDGVRRALADARDGDCLVLLALTQRDEVLGMIRSWVEDG